MFYQCIFLQKENLYLDVNKKERSFETTCDLGRSTEYDLKCTGCIDHQKRRIATAFRTFECTTT